MFTLYNTEGYTRTECDALNQEFETRFISGEWNFDRERAETAFNDEVSHR